MLQRFWKPAVLVLLLAALLALRGLFSATVRFLDAQGTGLTVIFGGDVWNLLSWARSALTGLALALALPALWGPDSARRVLLAASALAAAAALMLSGLLSWRIVQQLPLHGLGHVFEGYGHYTAVLYICLALAAALMGYAAGRRRAHLR